MSKEKEIALFRYGVIAPVLNDASIVRAKHFKEMSKLKFEIPGTQTRRNYSIASFKEWFQKYKNGGFDALYPSKRSDKGVSKKITSQLHSEIQSNIESYPYLSVSGIYRMLINEKKITKSDFTENTLRTYIKANGLKSPEAAIVGRKKFESPGVNMLWISDFMHCYRITDSDDHNKKKKTYLCVIIDDHSRLIVGGEFFFNENSLALASTFKRAILQYGLPEKFYCDNGAVFSTQYLQEACARIGTALIHSRPYDSPSRGKVERFNRTVRQMFLPKLDFNNFTSLAQLNESFHDWIKNEYHTQHHHGIKDSPQNRYIQNLPKTKVKRITEIELDLAFYKSFKRKVKNDSTVSIDSILYEVPPEYIKEKHEFRCPLGRPLELSLYIDGKAVCKVSPVNLRENFERPYTGIHFNSGDNNDPITL